MSDFTKLEVWQKAMKMVVNVYNIINNLPPEERFCLGQQMRNCSVSVPSNIAEGHSRNSTKEFIHHLNFSRGSAAELQTQLMLCEMLGYVKQVDVDDLLFEIQVVDRMMNKLIDSLKKRLG